MLRFFSAPRWGGILLGSTIASLAVTGVSCAEEPAAQPAKKSAASLANEEIALSKPNTLTPSEKKAGWMLLFDGESFDGWRNYKKDGVSDGWKIEDGAMVRADKGAGDIITDEQYDNYELVLEFKISEGGNSGIIFGVAETGGTPWQTGPEIQVQDNAAGHDPQKAGWLYQLYQPRKPGWVKQVPTSVKTDEEGRIDATRPAGEWNQIYIRITKQQCAVIMNGYPYYQFVVGSDEWKEKVAASKFSKYPDFGKNTAGHICLQDHNDLVHYRNIKLRKLEPNGSVPHPPVDGELAVKPVEAFPELELSGWDPVGDNGKVRELRHICITHAGDDSNRLFLGTQRGVVHVIENKPDVKTSKVFLDIEKKVAPFTAQGANEEGFLGLAFHPKYAENGRFFAYYTAVDPPHTSIISEFKVSSSDPDKADPNSEKELLRIEQPFANHNGGPIAFGPDGHLYIALGDGGSAYDPFENGQNRDTLLGSILRIDVDNPADGKAYGIPSDNPFVGKKDARPEVYAYGFRNPWRIGFDRKTGQLWAADVGQDLWEEVNIVQKGGNYGWNGREGYHPFGTRQVHGSDPIPPVWEYDHQLGKSITGGTVYRGKSAPELEGLYLYADYVSGKLWALKVNEAGTAAEMNYSIPSQTMGVLAYGEDEEGEMYFSIGAANGRGIYKFESTGKSAKNKTAQK